MSHELIPKDANPETAAFVLNAVATAIEFTQKMHWQNFSEMDRDIFDTLTRQLRQYAHMLEEEVATRKAIP